MTLLLDERYETGPDGAAITTANTTFTAEGGTSTDGSKLFQSGAHEGSLCGRYTVGTVSGSMWTRFDAPSTKSLVYWRMYVRLVSVFPGNNRGIAYWRNSGGTVRARIEVNNDGSFTMKNGTTVVDSSTVTTATDAWCRLEWGLDSSSGQTLRIFVGANVDGTTPDETLTGAFSSTDGVQMLFGWAGALSNRSIDVDAVALDDAAWIGPVSAGGTDVALTGVVTGLTLAAPAGTVSAVSVGNVDVTGVVTGLTLAAPSGTVTTVTDVALTGAVTGVVVAAPAGTVTATGTSSDVALTGPPAGLTASAPAGTVSLVTNVESDGTIAGLTIGAPAGTVSTGSGVNLTGPATGLSLAAPAGTVTLVSDVALTGPPAGLTVGAPSGTVEIVGVTGDVALTGPAAALHLGSVAGTLALVSLVQLVGPATGLTVAAPAGSLAFTLPGSPVRDPVLTLDPVTSVLTLDATDSGLTLDPVDSTLTLT